MPAERLLQIFELMESHERSREHGTALCTVAAEVTNLSGAAIVLTSAANQFSPLCAGNDVVEKLMELEITLGEGPGMEASLRGATFFEADLLSPESSSWMFYTPEAVALGARAVFGYPLRIGAARFGSLILYRDEPGILHGSQSSDAYLMASVIGRAVLAMQAGAPGEDLEKEIAGLSMFDFTVHQAAGMLAVQASLPVKDALVALRSHAFTIASSPTSLAARVIARKTRYDAKSGAWRDELSA